MCSIKKFFKKKEKKLMEKNSFDGWHQIEPAKNNRFIIKLKVADIPSFLFRK
jgi:hypothetical protein